MPAAGPNLPHCQNRCLIRRSNQWPLIQSHILFFCADATLYLVHMLMTSQHRSVRVISITREQLFCADVILYAVIALIVSIEISKWLQPLDWHYFTSENDLLRQNCERAADAYPNFRNSTRMCVYSSTFSTSFNVTHLKVFCCLRRDQVQLQEMMTSNDTSKDTLLALERDA